jgi:hypothetical protein
MPGSKSPGPSVKDDKTYEALRDEGASKEKAARIANAKAGGTNVSKKGGQSGSYEDWSIDDLQDRAAELRAAAMTSEVMACATCGPYGWRREPCRRPVPTRARGRRPAAAALA